MGPAYGDASVHLQQRIASCVPAGAAADDDARVSDAVAAAAVADVEVHR